MKIFDRGINTYLRRLPDIPIYFFYLLKCFYVFRNPFDFIVAYLTRQPIKGGVVKLRNGIDIYLTDHPHDPITVFVIFIRNDYGDVPKNSLVVDIGANIGVFSLYAICRGADKVMAFEPNSTAFDCLTRNIVQNHLQDRIRASRLAVTAHSNQTVKFPILSSVYNSVLNDDTQYDFELVSTISLNDIAANVGCIDLLKIDCEGGEYEILFTSDKSLKKTRFIKLEYHHGKLNELIDCMAKNQLKVQMHKPDSPTYGNIWFHRS